MNAISSIQAAQPPLPSPSQPASGIPVAALPAETLKPYYYSPALTIDPTTGTDVIQIRDSSTGAVTAQYPSEKDIKAYQEKSLKPEDATIEAEAKVEVSAVKEAPPPVAVKAVPAEVTAAPAEPAKTPPSTSSILA